MWCGDDAISTAHTTRVCLSWDNTNEIPMVPMWWCTTIHAGRCTQYVTINQLLWNNWYSLLLSDHIYVFMSVDPDVMPVSFEWCGLLRAWTAPPDSSARASHIDVYACQWIARDMMWHFPWYLDWSPYCQWLISLTSKHMQMWQFMCHKSQICVHLSVI